MSAVLFSVTESDGFICLLMTRVLYVVLCVLLKNRLQSEVRLYAVAECSVFSEPKGIWLQPSIVRRRLNGAVLKE